MINHPVSANDVHVTLRNVGGSVQHYHHFLLGFLLPLMAAWDDLRKDGGRVIVRSCALFDPILHQLALPGLEIVPPWRHKAMLSDVTIRHIELPGFDYPYRYDAALFQRFRSGMFERYADEVADARRAIAPHFPGHQPRVGIIQRLPPDGFYNSAECEMKTSGAQRRSIANFDDMVAVLRGESVQILVVTLEGTSLFHQMALFSLLDVAIAQHGAALSNLLWSRPGTGMVEIVPRELEGLLADHNFMVDLGSCMGVRCTRVWQEWAHGSVGADAVKGALRHLL